MQKIVLDKNKFIDQFLSPVSRIAEHISLNFVDNTIYTVCANADGSVVLYVTYSQKQDFEKLYKLNLPDIKKFIRLLECIENDQIELTINDNVISYTTSTIKFKYFLLEESYIPRCPATPQKIQQLEYDTQFNLPIQKLNEIFKGSSIATDSDKLYIFTKDNKVYAELNDYERQNINNIVYLISDSYRGAPVNTAIPLILENVRLLAGLKVDLFHVKVNLNLKIISFEDTDNKMKFIFSALVK
jgi:hypothetical protein